MAAKKKATKKTTEKRVERPVLVTTEFRGVFFGYATNTNGSTITLKRARNCVYWPASNRGFLGLAESGPMTGARVGPPADIELRKITCVAEVSEAAARVWEAAPWA
jgi:hypothetical protein